MTQKLNPMSLTPFIDANGDPYVGAKLFVYVAGSSTKAAITQDEAGLTAHDNPIILNARGFPGNGSGASKPIWQTEGQAVDLVLAPSTDSDPPVSAIDTWEDITGINDTVSIGQSQWVSGPAPTYVGATSFTLAGDQTSDFHVGRRLKTTNSGGTIYSTITAAAYTTLTTVTVENDSGSLDSGLSAVEYGILTGTNTSTPGGTHYGVRTFNNTITFSKGADIASASALTLGTDGNYFDVTGTTTITSISSAGVGSVIKLHFDGALTLTHHATDLYLTANGEDITTVAGDEAEFIEYASGDWRLLNYFHTPRRPGWVVLKSGTVSAAATLEIVMTSYTGYKNKKLILTSFYPATDAQDLNMRVSTDGGSTYDSSGYVYAKERQSSAPTNDDTGGTNTTMVIGESLGAGIGESCNSEITMYNTTSSTARPTFRIDTAEYNSTPNATVASYTHIRNANQDTDAVQIYFSSGNIAGGEWTLMGMLE